jgi:type II secretion system protein I
MNCRSVSKMRSVISGVGSRFSVDGNSMSSMLTHPEKRLPTPSLRRGLTLLEVILGLAIFVGSIAVVSKLMELGVRASQFARLHTRAVMLAESKMGELVAGVVSLDAGGGDVFTEDPAWQWELSVSNGPVDGLRWVSVTVSPASSGELATNREPVEFTLSRWLLDPSYSANLDSADSSSSSGSGSGSGTGTGSGGGTGTGGGGGTGTGGGTGR